MECAARDIIVRPLNGAAEYAACVALQERTWGEGFAERVPATILRIAQEMGGIASGAFDESGRLLGFVFGITGWVDRSPVHWSDMLAVAPEARNCGVGTTLKLHQRAELLARGVEITRWTFDPLQARNGYLNLSRLGAVARAYGRDYYEHSDSPLHAHIGTDRLIVTWELASERVSRRLAGHESPPGRDDVEHLPLLNPLLSEDPLECADPHDLPDVAAVRIAVPSDINAIRDRDPDLALRWRLRTRAAFEAALNRGLEVRELVRAGNVGWYLLTRGATQ
jgi:predicted GNAT superfamily acetyltransferase